MPKATRDGSAKPEPTRQNAGNTGEGPEHYRGMELLETHSKE